MAKPTTREEAFTKAAEHARQLTEAGAKGRVSVEDHDGTAVVVERGNPEFSEERVHGRYPA